jgi:peptide-methionine (R)-S-oxide reductase
MAEKVTRTEAEWRQMLSAEAYEVTRRHGTEPAFSHENFPKQPGRYCCACCGAELFDQAHKFDSGTGWPSFYQPAAGAEVETQEDRGWFMRRRAGGVGENISLTPALRPAPGSPISVRASAPSRH